MVQEGGEAARTRHQVHASLRPVAREYGAGDAAGRDGHADVAPAARYRPHRRYSKALYIW